MQSNYLKLEHAPHTLSAATAGTDAANAVFKWLNGHPNRVWVEDHSEGCVEEYLLVSVRYSSTDKNARDDLQKYLDKAEVRSVTPHRAAPAHVQWDIGWQSPNHKTQ